VATAVHLMLPAPLLTPISVGTLAETEEKLVVLPVLSESIAAQQHQKAQVEKVRET
jgi:hypothetical protein